MKVIIPFTLPSLNEYIDVERTNRYKAAKMKRNCQDQICIALSRQIRGRLKEPVVMDYLWVEKDRRRDKSNITGWARKVIEDALVQIKALRNDGWDNIENWHDDFAVDKLRPRIEIEITTYNGKS